MYFSANPNGEAEVVMVYLRQVGSIKKLKFEVDFADMSIKGRAVKGNIVTKYPVKKIELKEEGVSTLKPRRIWFDETVKRLNVDDRGELLGEFKGEDRLLIITQNGVVKTIKPELTTRFNEDMIVLEKWSSKKPISAIYWEAEKERFYVKRFLIENPEKEENFIGENPKNYLEIVSTDYLPVAEVVYNKIRGKEQRPNDIVEIEDFIAIKGIKALGNQLTTDKVKQINLLDPKPFVEPEDTSPEDMEVVEEAVETGTLEGQEKTSPDFSEGKINKKNSHNDEAQIKLFEE